MAEDACSSPQMQCNKEVIAEQILKLGMQLLLFHLQI